MAEIATEQSLKCFFKSLVVASAPELAAALSQPVVVPPSQGLDAAALGLDQLADAPLLIEEEKKKPKKESKTKPKVKSPKPKKMSGLSLSQKKKETGMFSVASNTAEIRHNKRVCKKFELLSVSLNQKIRNSCL